MAAFDPDYHENFTASIPAAAAKSPAPIAKGPKDWPVRGDRNGAGMISQSGRYRRRWRGARADRAIPKPGSYRAVYRPIWYPI